MSSNLIKLTKLLSNIISNLLLYNIIFKSLIDLLNKHLIYFNLYKLKYKSSILFIKLLLFNNLLIILINGILYLNCIDGIIILISNLFNKSP